MKQNVYPLTMQQVDWKTFIKVCTPVCGSPTRGLDDEGIDLKNPVALLGALDFKNRPAESIRNSRRTNNALGCIHFSFIAVVEDWVIAEISCCLELTLQSSDSGRKKVLILAGTLDIWFDAVVRGCGEDRSPEVREIFNEIYQHYKTVGLSGIWAGYESHPLTDGTFILVDR